MSDKLNSTALVTLQSGQTVSIKFHFVPGEACILLNEWDLAGETIVGFAFKGPHAKKLKEATRYGWGACSPKMPIFKSAAMQLSIRPDNTTETRLRNKIGPKARWTERLTVRITPEMRAELESHVDGQVRSASAVARQALAQWLLDNERGAPHIIPIAGA